jgi:endonuclease YncB( thermonuclease family)
VSAEVTAVAAGETLEVAIGGKKETVHLAGVDAPELDHASAELAWFGDQARAASTTMAPVGSKVCVADEIPPLVDRGGHRIVYLTLPDGRDLGAELVARGFGLAREGDAARRETYIALERTALASAIGGWGELEHDVSAAILPQPFDGAGGGRSGGARPRPPMRRRG